MPIFLAFTTKLINDLGKRVTKYYGGANVLVKDTSNSQTTDQRQNVTRSRWLYEVILEWRSHEKKKPLPPDQGDVPQ